MIYLFKNVIDSDTRIKIQNVIYNLYDKGAMRKNQAGPFRQTTSPIHINNLVDLEFIKDRVKNACGISDYTNDTVLYGDFISLITSGGFVHEHTDKYSGFSHARANILISKPINGGMPIINGKRYEIEEGDGWLFFPDTDLHSTDIVAGDKPRMTISFGFTKNKRI
mgnify:CR=1 FL=1